jgi:hypothetical protein
MIDFQRRIGIPESEFGTSVSNSRGKKRIPMGSTRICFFLLAGSIEIQRVRMYRARDPTEILSLDLSGLGLGHLGLGQSRLRSRLSRSWSLYISVTKIDTEPNRHCFRSRQTETETTETETDRDREARARYIPINGIYFFLLCQTRPIQNFDIILVS